MLKITIPSNEYWDEVKEEFIKTKEQTLQLEHSLVSISKWEAKYNKEFLSKEAKTKDEVLYYVQCMTLTQNVDPSVYNRLTRQNFTDINNYIDAPMTASSVREEKYFNGVNRERVTSELIYYWMIVLGIPFECQKWHLNRLLMLIRICNAKNKPRKKSGMRDLYKQHNDINAANKKRFNTRG